MSSRQGIDAVGQQGRVFAVLAATEHCPSGPIRGCLATGRSLGLIANCERNSPAEAPGTFWCLWQAVERVDDNRALLLGVFLDLAGRLRAVDDVGDGPLPAGADVAAKSSASTAGVERPPMMRPLVRSP